MASKIDEYINPEHQMLCNNLLTQPYIEWARPTLELLSILYDMRHILLLALILSFSVVSFSKDYNYSELSVLDYDEMKSLVMQRLRRARLEDDLQTKTQHYDDSLNLVFSRPNSDNMIEKLLPQIREELNSNNKYFDHLADMSTKCSTALSRKDVSLSLRSTCVVILNNLMSELRPELQTNEKVKKIYLGIRDAKIKIGDDVRVDRKLRSMLKSFSPSETAREILKLELPEEFGKDKRGFWQRLFS